MTPYDDGRGSTQSPFTPVDNPTRPTKEGGSRTPRKGGSPNPPTRKQLSPVSKPPSLEHVVLLPVAHRCHVAGCDRTLVGHVRALYVAAIDEQADRVLSEHLPLVLRPTPYLGRHRAYVIHVEDWTR